MSISDIVAPETPAGGPSITVCVPVYNVEQYLEECLDSIFSQDYMNFDVVMVDDGSSDRSGAICDEYVERYPQRALVIHKGNEGSLLARHDGYIRATGQYVMCVDADDLLVPDALGTVAAAAGKTGADVVRFGFTRTRGDVDISVGTDCLQRCQPEEKSAMLRLLCRSTSGSENPMWFKAVRRECVGVDIDLASFQGLSFAEDFLQTIIVYDRANTFCTLDARLYYYRPGTGITRSYNQHFYRDVCRCLDEAESYALRWERDYACDGLLAGLAACRLDSAAQYAEWLASRGDTSGLDALRASEDFIRCIDIKESSELLRLDRRFVLAALKKGIYSLVAAVAKIRKIKKSKRL